MIVLEKLIMVSGQFVDVSGASMIIFLLDKMDLKMRNARNIIQNGALELIYTDNGSLCQRSQ